MSLRDVSAERQLLNREELAERLGCSVSTVDRMRRDGMPVVRWGRSFVRFDPVRALAWLADQEKAA